MRIHKKKNMFVSIFSFGQRAYIIHVESGERTLRSRQWMQLSFTIGIASFNFFLSGPISFVGPISGKIHLFTSS